MRFARAWLPLALTALILTLLGSALAGPHFLCRMTGRIVDHCCCAKQADTGCTRALKSADCCEWVDADARANTGTLRATIEVPPAVLVSTLALPSRALPRSSPERTVIHAGRGPPRAERLFAAHCAFLI
jgi:hypothetical protein